MIPAIQELNFPKKEGKQYATLTHATATLADMGEKTITTQVKIDGDIVPDFSYDWEVEFQGEKYIMPLRIPAGAKGNETLKSEIDLTFQHWAIYQLKRWPFVTIQPIEAGTYIADEEVADVQLNLKDFCDLFRQVLEYYYGDTITIDLNPAWKYDKTPTLITIDHTYIWNVLIDAFHDKYGVRWAIEPREDNDNTVKGGERYVIKVGYPTTEVDHIFEYGFEGGLLKVERQAQNEDIRNIIKGRGGDENIPRFYFKKSDDESTWRTDPDWVEELKAIYFSNLMPATFRSYIQGWKAAHISKYPGYEAIGESNAYAPWAYRKGYTDTKFHPVEFVADEITINSEVGDRYIEILPDFAPCIKQNSSIYRYGPLQATLDNNDDIYPTIQGTGLDIAVDVEQIESDDIEESVEGEAVLYNVRGSAVDIYDLKGHSRHRVVTPRTEFTVPQGKTVNFNAEIRVLKGRLDRYSLLGSAVEIENSLIRIYDSSGTECATSKLTQGTYYYELDISVYNTLEKSVEWVKVGTEEACIQGAVVGEQKWTGTFHVWVKNIWETVKQLNESYVQYSERVWKPILGDRDKNTAKVIFTIGALAHEDYEFTIVDFPVPDMSKTYTDADGVRHMSHWRIKLAKSDAELEATGLYVPSTQKQGKAGDTFAFIGTEMTHVPYVVKAEERLDDRKKDHLGEVKEIKPTFVVTTDRVRLSNEGKPDALINQLRAGNTLRLADKRFIQPMGDRAYETLYLQSVTYTFREPSSDDAALNPDVEIVLGEDYATSVNPVSVMQGEISSMQKMLGSISNVEQIVRAVGDKLYLRKDGISDRSFSPTEFFSLVTSGDFRPGLIGGEGWGFFKDENGNWVLEADRVNVRQEMQVNTLVINQAEGKGGMEIDTGAFMEVTRVVDTADGYICYFDSKDGSVANLFHVDDVAFCNRWTPENKKLKFYKRRVVAVGVDNITLTKERTESSRPADWPDSGVNGTGIPTEKDNIIHFGNYNNKERQYVKVRDVVGGGYERYIEELNSVNAVGVEYYSVGKQAGESRWFVGNKDLVPYSGKGDGSYIEYINRRFNLNNVTLSVNTKIGDKTIEEYIKLVSPPVTQEDIEGFVNAIVDPKLEGIQDQIDGVIESFFGFGAPTLNNYPANEWTTGEARKAHERDTYTDKTEYVDDVTTPTAGQSWKWQYTSPTDYGWVKIADSDAVKALLDAAKAQDTADGKRRVFTSQPTTPYDKGDLWVNATYPVGTTSTTRDPVNGAYFNDILRCGAPRSTGSFNISDWGLSSNYTDDTLAQQAINAISDYEYLKTAMVDGASQAIGGLFLSSYIKLGSWDKSNPEKPLFDKPWSGLNGIYINGRTPSYFAGGDMVDRFGAQDNRLDVPGTRYATAMVRMDGSAYFAAGNIGFCADGSGWLGNDTNGIHFSSDGSMSFGNGIKININEGEVGLKETLESLLNYVTGIDGIFIPVDKQGNRVSWTSPDLYAVRSAKGFYSDSFITAKGINGTQEGDGSGEGGASYDRLDAWADYSADRAGDVLSAKLGWDLHTRLGNVYAKTEADSRFQPKGDYLTQHQSLAHLLRIDGANGTWAGVSALIGKLSDATAVIEDATLLVTSHVDPSSTSMYYRRPASALWGYVKSKADALYQPKGNYLTAISKSQVEAVLTGVITTHVHQRLVSSNATDLDTLKGTQFQVNYGGGGNTHAGKPSGTDAYGALSFQSATGWYTQILRSSNTNNGLFVRDFNGSAWTAWDRILTAGNYPSVLDGRYVNATGDTMTGPLNISLYGLTFEIGAKNTSGIHLYTSDATKPIFINTDLLLVDNGDIGNAGSYRAGTVYANAINVTSAALVSNLNADLLDGKHRTEILRYDGMPASTMSLNDRVVNNGIDIFSWDYATNSNVSAKPSEYATSGAASVVSFGGAYPFQILSDYNDTNRLYYRSYYGSKGWKAWRKFAFVDSNVASATKLADDTAYTAWGRTFFENGKPKSVSGDMAGVGSLSASGEIRTSSPNAFRAVRGGYGFFIRNDGIHTYFMFTDKGNELGGWNELRPLYINNATGRVTMGNGLSVGEAVVTTLKIGSVTISYDSANEALKISGGGLYSESFITAKGISSTSQGSDGGGSDFGLMKTWPTADPGIGTMDALGANLGWELYAKASANASSISSLSSRITSLEGKNYLDALTLAQSGTGNAVTSVSLSADKKTLTVVKGTTFLTSHQSLANYYTKTETRNNFARALYSNDVLNGDMNTMLNNNTFLGSINATANTPNGNGWYNVIQVAHRNGAGDGSDFVGQIALGMTVNHERMYFRTHRTRAWQTVLTTANYAGALDSRYVTLSTEQTISGAKTFGSDCFKVVANVSNYVRVLRSTNTAIPTSDRDYAWQFYHWASAGENRGLSIWSYDGDNKIFNHVATFKAVPSNSLVVNGAIVKSGGTASQFLMADGSLATKKIRTNIGTLDWTTNANGDVTIATVSLLAFWNGAYSGTSSNLAYCNKGAFGDIVTQSLASLDGRYVNASGDTMTGKLSINTYSRTLTLGSRNDSWAHYVTDAPSGHWFNKNVAVDGEIYAGSGYINKVWHAGNDGHGSGLDADMLDGKHLGNTSGYVVQWTSFPTFASLVSQGYLAEAVQNDNQEYFKALLKWVCANYTGEVQLIGKATPNSQGMLTIHIYNCDNVQDGLPSHSSAVYEAYAGGVTAFGTMSYVWQWNNGAWNGTASTAIRLKDSFSLWGQSFYGNNVKGSISSDYFSLNDVAGNPYLRLTKDSVNWYAQAYDTKVYLGAGINKSLSVDRDGHVGIGYGTANPTCPLDVNGDIRAMGWLRFGTWGRVGYADGIGWLQMASSVTNRITAMNATEMTRLEIKSAMTAFSGQITNSNSAGNSTTIAYGAIELSHATPYIDFHFGRSAEDFDVRLINDEAGVLHLVGGSLKLGNGYIRWDSSRGCFAFSAGIYSESFITAKAVGSTTADASDRDDKEIGGAIKVQSDEPEESELEALRLRVAQLEQRINALTA